MGPDAAGAINGYYATVGLNLAEKLTSQWVPPTQYQIVTNIEVCGTQRGFIVNKLSKCDMGAASKVQVL